jgi:hypothetical protein
MLNVTVVKKCAVDRYRIDALCERYGHPRFDFVSVEEALDGVGFRVRLTRGLGRSMQCWVRDFDWERLLMATKWAEYDKQALVAKMRDDVEEFVCSTMRRRFVRYGRWPRRRV